MAIPLFNKTEQAQKQGSSQRMKKEASKTLQAARNYIFSRRVFPVLKGTLAYLLAIILVFTRKFDTLSQFPLAYSGMMIIVIAGNPGGAVGACLQGVGLALLGVLLGCVGFVMLAHLSHVPVAQGVVFAILVYVLALVKSKGPKYLGFSLLCVLTSFNGVYTSYLLGGFSGSTLVSYLSAYLWGGAIVLTVNILIVPTTSERALRQTLVTSLAHIGTFAHLLSKGYTLELTEEERNLRDHLARTIRADFGYLTQKIDETTIEINYSKFSMKDYQSFVASTRSLQQALITAHSSLIGVERQDMELFKEKFLPETIEAFCRLRRSIDLTIRDLGSQLGFQPMIIPATEARYKEFMDVEHSATSPRIERTSTNATSTVDDSASSTDISERLREVSGRLTAEVANVTESPTRIGTPDLTRPSTVHTIPESLSAQATKESPTSRNVLFECGMDRLRRQFDLFSSQQHDLLQDALLKGDLFDASDSELRVYEVMRMTDIYGTDGIDVHGEETNDNDTDTLRNRKGLDGKPPTGAIFAVPPSGPKTEQDTKRLLMEGHSLIRVWGFLFALEQFVDQLELLWGNISPKGIERQKRLHIHFFEALQRPHQKSQAEDEDADIPLQEALAILEQRPYTPVKRNIWQRLDQVQQLLQSSTSIYAAKVAAAASVFGTLIYASVPRPWFISKVGVLISSYDSFSLSGGLLTIFVALTPTLGQSFITFVLQIVGSGIGYLWGLAVLEMFRNIGGFKFNPYGVVGMLFPYVLLMEWTLYERPAWFVLSLLALNGTGVLVITEWIELEYLHREGFDSPALRTGKAISALMVAVAIVAIFQLFVLRNPARRTLRKALAALSYQTLSYMVLLHGFGRVMLASRPDDRPPKAALARIERELRHRELKLQSSIIQMSPLMAFAAAEPEFSRPFKRNVAQRIIRGNQLILDRLREARAALGTDPFEEFIIAHYATILAPYRARNVRLMKTQLYLIASSLQSKAPLPQFTPGKIFTNRTRANMVHDYLVLSARFAKTAEGQVSIRSREFLRFMSHVLCSTSIIQPLLDMEEASKELYGQLEEKLL